MGAHLVDTRTVLLRASPLTPAVRAPDRARRRSGVLKCWHHEWNGCREADGEVARALFFCCADAALGAQVRAYLKQRRYDSLTPKSSTVSATITCAAEKCAFFVSLRSSTIASARISSLNLDHTCSGNVRRKRELSAALLRPLVPGLVNLRGQNHRGDAKQVRCWKRLPYPPLLSHIL
jgi:hypothetical protein